jgi:hypothetical protein
MGRFVFSCLRGRLTAAVDRFLLQRLPSRVEQHPGPAEMTRLAECFGQTRRQRHMPDAATLPE